jgi:hypothetical protein
VVIDETIARPRPNPSLAATLVIGACAGFYPAWRAARMPPTGALAAP